MAQQFISTPGLRHGSWLNSNALFVVVALSQNILSAGQNRLSFVGKAAGGGGEGEASPDSVWILGAGSPPSYFGLTARERCSPAAVS
jgi:hypothetical protein